MTVDMSLIGVILNFIFLLIVLNAVLYKPLRSFFEKRQDQIKHDLHEAARLNEIASQRVTEKNEELNNFRLECRSIKSRVIKDAENERDNILHIAKIKAEDLVKHAENQILEKNKKAEINLEKHLSGIIADLTGKLLAEKIDSAKDQELINKLLDKRGN